MLKNASSGFAQIRPWSIPAQVGGRVGGRGEPKYALKENFPTKKKPPVASEPRLFYLLAMLAPSPQGFCKAPHLSIPVYLVFEFLLLGRAPLGPGLWDRAFSPAPRCSSYKRGPLAPGLDARLSTLREFFLSLGQGVIRVAGRRGMAFVATRPPFQGDISVLPACGILLVGYFVAIAKIAGIWGVAGRVTLPRAFPRRGSSKSPSKKGCGRVFLGHPS